MIESLAYRTEVLVYFKASGTNHYIGRKATYDQIIARLDENGEDKPDRTFNRQFFNGKLIAEGLDEDFAEFWVSIEKPGSELPWAW